METFISDYDFGAEVEEKFKDRSEKDMQKFEDALLPDGGESSFLQGPRRTFRWDVWLLYTRLFAILMWSAEVEKHSELTHLSTTEKTC